MMAGSVCSNHAETLRKLMVFDDISGCDRAVVQNLVGAFLSGSGRADSDAGVRWLRFDS